MDEYPGTSKVRVRIEVTEWVEFDASADWWDGEIEDTPEAIWDAVSAMYQGDPGLAWEATEGENWVMKVQNQTTGDFVSRAHQGD